MAGRGFGKTRTGAEWVRDRVETGRSRRIALVAPTAADVRDVMVEGESGLLSVCPPWNRPAYEPSKRRLTWPNGAIATTYSADEPERLRGPQHDLAWCLAGDTRVLMADGTERPIVDVRVGDLVATRIGPRRVTASMLTKQNAEVFELVTLDGRSIIGTGDHLVGVIGGGFIPIRSLARGMEVAIPAPSSSTQTIASVARLAKRCDVYDITVEGAHEFFANGILVHNCEEIGSWRRPQAWDNLMFGLRLRPDPRACVTFTPRRTTLVKSLLEARDAVLTKGSSYENRANLAPTFFSQILAAYEGTRLGLQEIHAELSEIAEGAWFPSFSPRRHVTADAEYRPGLPVLLAIDCGTSIHTGAVFFQVRERDGFRFDVNVFADYHAEGLMSETNARAILDVARRTCQGWLDRVRLDPASGQRTGVGPVVYAEYERVFGRHLVAPWPRLPVVDGLNLIETLLGSESRAAELTIHPRCTHLIEAFKNYQRAQRGGEWLDDPVDPQHPHEDLMDALRGGLQDRFPDGRRPAPAFRVVQARGGRLR